jgi:hypothetical protein
MSADDETLYKRLQDNYPHAYALARQISIKFTEIYKQVYPDSGLRQDEKRDLTFHVFLDNDGNPRLAVDQSSMILFAAIAEAISKLQYPGESLEGKTFEEIEKDFIQQNKACPNPQCGEINKVTDEKCYKCGTNLK